MLQCFPSWHVSALRHGTDMTLGTAVGDANHRACDESAWSEASTADAIAQEGLSMAQQIPEVKQRVQKGHHACSDKNMMPQCTD